MSTPYRRHKASINSTDTFESDTNSLYPGQNHELSTSMSSLWIQHALIERNLPVNRPSKTCCSNAITTRHWILKVIFLFVVGAALILSVVALVFSVFSPKKLHFSGGDQVLFPLSTHFNEKLLFSTVKKLRPKYIKLYLLPSIPKISEDKVEYTFGSSFQMSSWTYQYWGLHLLKGTTVKISLCADLHLQFYMLYGANKLARWSEHILYSDYEYHMNIEPQEHCSSKDKFKSHLLTASRSDVYYLLFSSSVGWRFLTGVSVILHFNRTYYDTSLANYSCHLSNSSCYAKYAYASTDIALLQAVSSSNRSANIFQKHTIVCTPKPRWLFYITIFGGFYVVVLGLTILYSIWRFCVKCNSRNEDKYLLENKEQRNYSTSLKSHAGRLRDQDWVVVSTIKSNLSTECLVEISERDVESLAQSMERCASRVSRERLHSGRRSRLSSEEYRARRASDLSGSYCSQDGSLINSFYQAQPYNADQQFMDSCMTSASVSAI